LVYQPEVRSKPVCLAAIDYGAALSYQFKSYPLTSSSKDTFQGQYLKFSSQRQAVAIRESSTSLRVGLVSPELLGDESKLRDKSVFIKVGDFIKDFCVETIKSRSGLLLFVGVLMSSNLLKSFVVDPQQRKSTVVSINGNKSIDDSSTKDDCIKVDSSKIVALTVECKTMICNTNTVGLFLLGFSPKLAVPVEGPDTAITSDLMPTVYSVLLEFEDFSGAQSTSVKQLWSDELVETKKKNDPKSFECFQKNEAEKLSARRGRASSAILTKTEKEGQSQSFVACLVVPSKSLAVFFTWKLSASLNMQDFNFVLTQESTRPEDHSSLYSVYPMFFEDTSKSQTSVTGGLKDGLCLLKREVGQSEGDLVKICEYLNLYFDLNDK
jgi:hypothetical protein